MSSLDTDIQIHDLAANLVLEICGYLGIHDQGNMKRICQWWRLNLPDTYLSRMVEVDGFRLTNQCEYLLERSLNAHVKKNTRILVLRHITFEPRSKKIAIIARAIKQKEAHILLLILRDCNVQTEFAGAAFCWLYKEPQELPDFVLQRLIFATRKLILVNYTILNALGEPVQSLMHPGMPCRILGHDGRNMLKELPVFLPRLEFDCTKPFLKHYHAYIMALNFNCPEVSSEVRNDVVQLYSSWIHNGLKEYQWKTLGRLIKGLNDGKPEGLDVFGGPDYCVDIDVPALRQLDPLTLNKLTMEALHRFYF